MRFAPLLIACLALAGCDKAPAPPAHDAGAVDAASLPKSEPGGTIDRSHAGSPMPAAMFLNPEGEKVSLDDIGDKPLLLNLWATWCAPCIAEMPTLDGLAERDRGKLDVVAVSQDMEGKPKVDSFFAKNKFTALQPYLDPEGELAAELKVPSLPTTILYGADGKERWRVVGDEDWRGEKAAKLLAEAGNQLP